MHKGKDRSKPKGQRIISSSVSKDPKDDKGQSINERKGKGSNKGKGSQRSSSPERGKEGKTNCQHHRKGIGKMGKDGELRLVPDCVYFKKGTCTQGSRCKFRHPRDTDSSSPPGSPRKDKGSGSPNSRGKAKAQAK